MKRWQHKKRGSQYTEIGLASLQSEKPIAEGATLVVYLAEEDRTLWVRPHDEFHDGRFVRLADRSEGEVDYHLSRNSSVAVASNLAYLPMDTCPISVKVLLLNRGGVATLGIVRREERDEWRGWFPLPKERKAS